MLRPPALALHERVAQARVRERATDEHLVVAAPRAVLVEVHRLHAERLEVLARGAIRRERPRRRDVVRRDRVADHHEDARVRDVRDVFLRAHVLEERRLLHVRRLRVPREHRAGGGRHRLP